MKHSLLTAVAVLISTGIFAQANVRITSVNPDMHEVTLTNMGNVSQNVGTHWLCNFPDYLQINSLNVISGVVNLTAGSSVTVIFPHAMGNDGEVGYYISNMFTSSAAMRDYMEWGFAGHTRESIAVAGGYWTTGQFVPNEPGFLYIGGPTDHGSAFWSFQTPGCNEPTACNYNPAATTNDGTCEFASCAGCTYPAAVNYDPTATIDDLSCIYDEGCVGDFNNDGVVGTADLLQFVAAYGIECD